MTLTLEIDSRIMAFLGHMEIIEVETIGLDKACFKITMTIVSWSEVSTYKEIHPLSDIIFASYAVSQDLMRNIAM